MRTLLVAFFGFLSVPCIAQSDTSKWLRAFPITGYIVPLNDSTNVVQVHLTGESLLNEKTVGIIKGVYLSSNTDTVRKGYGRCNLIKGEYFYFSIGHNTSGIALKEGDLLYAFVPKPPVYDGRITRLSSHYIGLQNVSEEPFYDRFTVFSQLTERDEEKLVDSMVRDIRFTGNYFTQNNPSMDQLITTGKFTGKKILTLMVECQSGYLTDFLDYMIARPRLYAGREWKLPEVFATWLSSGAPTVVK